ncbi:MAG: phosphoribosyl-ATP diphosphatase [Phycisphaerales bacterium]
MNGNAVQLIGGKKQAIDAGDPIPIAEKFATVGEIALIDLDAALSKGENTAIMKDILQIAPCRVGGGIRDVDTAIKWLDAGASKVILGTAATPEILKELPKERVIAALDARNDQVVVEGWTKTTNESVEDRMAELAEYVGGFLVTFVEREGRMGGLPIERAKQLSIAAGGAKLTVAGGVKTTDDVMLTDRIGVDAQVGMALYTGALELADCFTAPLISDRPDGLWPTVVCDERGVTLGLVYSNQESVRESINTGTGVYYSRSRGGLWRKGQESGNTQQLLKIDTDCDRDALRFTVRQAGSGFCHTGTQTCFGQAQGLSALESIINTRIAQAVEGSYTSRLLNDPDLLQSKLIEESIELQQATNKDEASHEAADLIYFAMVRALQLGSSLSDIERELDRRSIKVSRRPGNAKAITPLVTKGI